LKLTLHNIHILLIRRNSNVDIVAGLFGVIKKEKFHIVAWETVEN